MKILPEPILSGLLVDADSILNFAVHTLDNPQVLCKGKIRKRINTFIIAMEFRNDHGVSRYGSGNLPYLFKPKHGQHFIGSGLIVMRM